jgi:UPF0271 protein
METMDINADLGESFGNWRLGNDEQLIPEITTANVACGFHGGDPVTMVRTVALAQEHGVAVGAHPGLPDLLGFGRRVLSVSPEDLHAYVLYQVGSLQGVLAARGMSLHHVKPHGALYAMLRTSEELSEAVLEAITAVGPEPLIYWPAPLDGQAFVGAARRAGVHVVGEIYVDLDYAEDGALVLQRTKGPTGLDRAIARLRRFLEQGTVDTVGGGSVPLEAESLCIHGDGPNAVELVRTLRGVLGDLDVAIRTAGAPAARGTVRGRTA